MPKFDSFVILAEMRTGSNLLEAALNMLADVTCHGEAFNPALIGYPDRAELLGISRAARDRDPMALWDRIRNAPGLNGCRYFHDHDPRVLDAMLDDPSCAKIVLTRNPVESYVSLKIARATGQWKLGDARNRKSAQAVFDANEFEAHLAELQDFQILLMRALQTSGQTAFYVDYDDLRDLEVLNGLAAWLGVPARLAALPSNLVVQNPGAIGDKVANFPELEAALARLDRFNLSRTPNFEPRRGPAVPRFVASDRGLVYMPLPSPFDTVLRNWFHELGAVEENFTQGSLRQWKDRHPGHRGFTVLRHPLERAHLALAALLRRRDMADIREALRRVYKLPIPAEGTRTGPKDWDPKDWAGLLEQFMGWLKANLNNQTNVRVALIWASQSAMIEGFSRFAAPDVIMRHDRLDDDLAWLCWTVGIEPPHLPPEEAIAPVALAEIWSPRLEEIARDLYARDYNQFGFKDWGVA
ncbi:nodulation protein NodH [Sinirhodobacter populi]|uniref:Nodulation protein NodH n=1 Tax=Paenirhodobacter populi TaxID=2306993 RepID=A0A443KBJ0_9RHOB|nr:nodulation protein NodH [Sinirhodobacter populi]RWR30179.1 nodulation protein NodH [Sinirhodobacter populi]